MYGINYHMLTIALLLLSQSVMAQENPSDALWDSLRKDDVAGVVAQIKSGISVVSSTDTETPLTYAIKRDSTEMVKALLDLGANANLVQPISQCTPLIVAAKNDKPKAVELLLVHQADVNVTGTFGRNSLNVAALFDSVDVAHLLLTKTNIDVNARGKLCPLAIASRQGYLNFVKILLNESKVAPSVVCLASAKKMAQGNMEPGSEHEAILVLLNSLK